MISVLLKNISVLLLLIFLLIFPVLAQEVIFTDSFESLPADQDFDQDGLLNGEEEDLGTDPRKPDTDGDGFLDGSEVAVGTDPLDENDFPMVPPDPTTRATDPEPGITTTIFDSTTFLYTGVDPTQTGVPPDTIELLRASVIRGRIMTRRGAPLPTVAVSILNHPELGQTLSRADGMFDLVVNGGGQLIVNYQLNGFLPAQRQLAVPWQAFVMADDVVLIRLDPVVTTVVFNVPGTVQMAMSSERTDEDGTRQAVLMIPKGTTAQLVMPDDSTVPVTTLDIRATEYTVGDMGPAAMPGSLPPSSGYTYAVEMSADEALGGAAKSVEFSQPLPFYVDNFLGFPAGTPVPTAYYDRQKGRWVPQLNGRVIKVLGKTGDLADLDVDGDDVADTGAALTDLGITDDERTELAKLYAVGNTFWRVPMSHFSPWDHNWPFGPPADAKYPAQTSKDTKSIARDTADCPGSIIVCQNQTLGESIHIAGTSLSLNYRSSSMPGYKLNKNIVLSVKDEILPASLKRTESTIAIAGREFHLEGLPSSVEDRVFTWDGRDVYDRPVQGTATANVNIGYVYDGDYQSPGVTAIGFGLPGEFPISADRTRQEVTLAQTYDVQLENRDGRGQALGGWTLDIQHHYDPVGRTLYLGNGQKRGNNERSDVNLFAGYVTGAHGWTGGSSFCSANPDLCVDGRPANQTGITGVKSVAFAADGTAYFTQDQYGHRIGQISPDGIMSSLVPISDGYELGEFNGDGGPASLAKVSGPRDIAVGPDGSVYIAERHGIISVIRKIDPEGIITTFAGGGDNYLPEGPATSLKIVSAWSMDVGPDGSVYVNDEGFCVVWRITPEGYMSIVAGNLDTCSVQESGVPATQTDIVQSLGMAVGSDGSIYLADTYTYYLWRITPDGIISRIAGTGVEAEEMVNGPAMETAIGDIRGIAVDADGTVWFMDYDFGVIRRLDNDGNITTAVGRGDYNSDFVGLNGPALQAVLGEDFNTNLVIGPDKNLYITLWTAIWSINPRFSGLSNDEILMASEDGLEVYQFSSSGRHLRTLNSLTGSVIYEFSYNADQQLESVTDSYGNVTSIERDGQGNPKAFVAPLGQRTEVQLDINGYLSQVTNPAGESVSLEYDPDGLLTKLTRPDNHFSTYTYDDLGLLQSADDGSGYVTQLERTELSNGFEIKRTSGMGAETIYRVERLANGDILLSNTDAAGAVTQLTQGVDGTRSVLSPNGATETQTIGPDPRLGMRSMGSESFTIGSPAGKSLLVESRRVVEMANANDLFSITSFTESRTVGGRTITEIYDAATRMSTVTTPEGRVSTTTRDLFGRVTEMDLGSGLDLRTWSYDLTGQVQRIEQGAHFLDYQYDLQGRVFEVTDAIGRQETYAYDVADRLSALTTPGSRIYVFSYDAMGLMRTIAMPNGAVHALDYAPFGGLMAYTPPGADAMGQAYDDDRRRVSVVLADGRTQTNTFDSAHRSDATVYPEATASYSYQGLTHQFETIAWTPASGPVHSQSFSYDGDLLTGVTLDLGATSDTFSYSLDSAWRLSGMQLNDEPVMGFTYNNDDQPVSYGPFSISRNGPAGAPSKYTDGTMTIDYVFDSMGRLTGRTHTVGATAIYDLQVDHITGSDLIGERTETVSGSPTTLLYNYSLDSEITTVTEGITEIETYSYDSNGNRDEANGTTASYDDQDRLQAFNGLSYSFDANGFMTGRGSDSFSYSTRGELLSATIGGQTVTYTYDAVGRQVARTVGSDTTQYLFGDPNDPFRLSASRAPDGTLTQYYYDQAGLLIGLEQSGERFYVITDQVGSPRLIVNQLAVIQREISYNGFGEIVADAGGFGLVIGFGGGLYDELTGLIRLGFRDYEPGTGRWTSRDPILFRGGQFNLYAYANNNPISLRDPSGLFCIGGSAYGGVGGGVKLCFDKGKWSTCFELGFGAGGGLSLEPTRSTAPRSDADYIEAKASIGCGPGQVSVGLKLDDCGNPLLSGGGQVKKGKAQFGSIRKENLLTGEKTISNSLTVTGGKVSCGDGALLCGDINPNTGGRLKGDDRDSKLSCKFSASLNAGVCIGSDFF